jgi:hypothetical protein
LDDSATQRGAVPGDATGRTLADAALAAEAVGSEPTVTGYATTVWATAIRVRHGAGAGVRAANDETPAPWSQQQRERGCSSRCRARIRSYARRVGTGAWGWARLWWSQ